MSNLKRYLLDFINFTLIWIIFVFFIAIVLLGAQIEFLNKIFKSLIPLAFFAVIFLLIWKIERSRLNKLKAQNMTELTLYLNYNHKFIDRIIIFFLPVLLILIAVLRGGVEIYDIIQATLVLIVLYIWHNFLFNKN